MSSENNCIHLSIGGGYGLTSDTKSTPADKVKLLEDMGVSEDLTKGAITPEPNRKVFDLYVNDGRSATFLDRAILGTGWEWELFDSPGENLPSVHLDLFLGSPSFHQILQWVAWEDFEEPPPGSIKEDDEDTVLGQRIILSGLKGAKELNGSHGRCGPWLQQSGRYHVTLENSGKAISVKASNLGYASKRSMDGIENLATPSSRKDIMGSWMTKQGSHSYSPLDPPAGDARFVSFDQYRGPLSARAMAVLSYVAETKDSMISFIRLPLDAVRKKRITAADAVEKLEFYERFVQELRTTDKARAQKWTKHLLKRRRIESWGDWLKLSVTIDALTPVVRRELYVSPYVSMAVSTTSTCDPQRQKLSLSNLILLLSFRRNCVIKFFALLLAGPQIFMHGHVDANFQ